MSVIGLCYNLLKNCYKDKGIKPIGPIEFVDSYYQSIMGAPEKRTGFGIVCGHWNIESVRPLGEAVYQECSCEASASIGPDQLGEHRNDAALRVTLVPEVSSA